MVYVYSFYADGKRYKIDLLMSVTFPGSFVPSRCRI